MSKGALAPVATTAEMRLALRTRYVKPEWAFFEEVANATGLVATRYADALALNLYPSRGLALAGFEIKHSRADWRRELGAPDKGEESIIRYCNQWWIVAPTGVVPAEELPVTWGLIECAQGKLREKVKAPSLRPVPLDRAFIAALLRRANEFEQSTVDALVRREVNAERDRLHAEYELRDSRARDELRTLRDKLLMIRERCGIDLLGWEPADDAAALLKAVLQTDLTKNYRGLAELLTRMGDLQTQLQAAIDNVPLMAGVIAAQRQPRKE